MSNFTNQKLVLDHELVDFELFFVNLEGRKGGFNTDGKRSFRLKFNDEEFAKALVEDGWNVKIFTPKNTNYEPYYGMDVKTKFKSDSESVRYNPEIHYINRKNDILCDASNIHIVDNAFDARKVIAVDLVVNPYHWGPNERGEGITAYIDAMYVYVEDSPFGDRSASVFGLPEDNDEELPF